MKLISQSIQLSAGAGLTIKLIQEEGEVTGVEVASLETPELKTFLKGYKSIQSYLDAIGAYWKENLGITYETLDRVFSGGGFKEEQGREPVPYKDFYPDNLQQDDYEYLSSIGDYAPISEKARAARLLGKIKSNKKAQAARKNGELGGRPKKDKPG